MLNYQSEDDRRRAATQRRDEILSTAFEWTADLVSLTFLLLLIYTLVH